MKNKCAQLTIALLTISIFLFQLGCKKDNTIAVTGITMNKTSINIPVDSTQQLMAVLTPANAGDQNVTWSSSNNAVATVSTSGLVTAISAGSTTIEVTTRDGNKTANCIVTVSNQGSLKGLSVASAATVNLTAEGTSDWARWPDYDHKATGGSKISNYSIVGSGTVYPHTEDPRTFIWTDGTPSVSGSKSYGINIHDAGNGFQLAAPAGQTLRTLKVYVGGYKSVGTLTAKLSDGSALDYVDINTPVLNAGGQYDVIYTLTYKAASEGQLLTVKWVQSSTAADGNVTLQAAALVQ